MSEAPSNHPAAPGNAPGNAPATKSMDEIMALCKRRGFVFQASEIYGGINGFWDYGPLGAQLKKNLRDAWWQDVVLTPPVGPTIVGADGKPRASEPVEMVGLDTCIIQHPKVWVASGHIAGFNDPMVECSETKKRYRLDHLMVVNRFSSPDDPPRKEGKWYFITFVGGDERSFALARKKLERQCKQLGIPLDPAATLDKQPLATYMTVIGAGWNDGRWVDRSDYVGPDAEKPGTLSEPRQFNLMFKTFIGATATEDDIAYLRPETAQGIFVNFKNVVDTSRVRVPFGIAQTGKAFRNEVTPRNFTFRSREFEQMEIEFFCHPSEAKAWYAFWCDWRMAWWRSLGLASDNLQLREHDRDELAHYAKEGAGTSDIEYRFPFTAPGFGELEGVAHRADFDLRQHQEHSKVKLDYFDTERGPINPKSGQPTGERYLPHVIEPSAGLDRGVLALLCEAYTPDPSRPSGVYMKFHPRIAPIKAAVFPLVNKDGMPEKAEPLHRALRKRFGVVEYDAKQTIGKRYARMDEAGCPFCFTIDGQTMTDDTVTVRHRDTLEQERIPLASVGDWLAQRIGAER